MIVCFLGLCNPIYAQEVPLFIGAGDTHSTRLPFDETFKYSITQQIFTAEEMTATPGTITSVAFMMANNSAITRELVSVYMINTDKDFFEYQNDWVNLSENELVYYGSVEYPGEEGAWCTINFQVPFEYTGDNVLLCVHDQSAFFETEADNARFYTYPAGSVPRSLTKASLQYTYDVTNLKDVDYTYADYEGSNPYYNSQVKFTMELDNIDTPITVTPYHINLDERPSGAWMKPVEVKISSNVASLNISSIESSNPFFIIDDVELPAEVTFGRPMTIGISHGEGSGNQNGQLTITYDNNETEVVEMSAVAYAPITSDVWEMAEVINSAEYTATPEFSELRNNYSLPFDGEDGPDAVYELNFDSDVLLTATSTGDNGKAVLYEEGFGGKGGPDVDNYYPLQTSPVITSMFVPAGTYYIVLSGTTSFTGNINVEDAPAPVKADNPSPANEATKVTDPILSWEFEQYTKEYQLLLDTQNPPQNVVVDWTDDLQTEYNIGELSNNQLYYWQVNVRNTSATVNGDVWSFSTSYNVPTGLWTVNTKICEGTPVTMYWYELESCDGFNIYCNGNKINTEIITETTYVINDLPYNKEGHKITVTAVYGEMESDHSAPEKVYVTGMAEVTGKTFEIDGISVIPGVDIILKGVDDFGEKQSYAFTTNENGVYSGQVLVGNYTVIATVDGYQEVLVETDVVYGQTSTIDFMLYEMYYPVSEVVATKLEDSSVKVEWSMDRALKSYNIYRKNIHLDDAKLIEGNVTSTSYTDNEWMNLGEGVYKWGVASVYEGNRALETILEETFEGGVMPEGWTTYQDPLSEYYISDWGVKDNSNNYNYLPYKGQYAAFSAGSSSSSDYYMVTPALDLSLCTNVTLSFYYIAPEWDGDINTLSVAVSSNPTGPWTEIWSSNAADVPSWTEVEIDMIEYAMKDTYIAFINENEYGYCVGVDEILVSSVSSESEIVWSNGISSDMYTTMEVAVETNSDDPVTGTVINFVNLVENEYNYSVTIESGDSYTWNDFRKGKYALTVSKAGFTSDNEGQVYDVWEPTQIECLLTEILYPIENLYVSPTGWVTWDDHNSRELVSYDIKFNGMFQESVTTPYYQLKLDNYPLEEGEVYTTSVVAKYSSGSSTSVKYAWTYTGCDNFETVTDFEVNNENGSNVLSWILPQVEHQHESLGNYMAYDNQINIDGVGMFHQGSFYWAVMFPAEYLTPFVGQKLLKVLTFDYMAHDGELSIYLSGSNAPLNLVHSQPYACSGSKEYITIDLTKSIEIANENIWIVFYNYNGQYVAPAGTNTGDPNGRWLSVDGVSWYDMYLDTGYDYTWNISAYVNYEGEYPGMEKDIIGTMIYRNGELITAEPVEATSFTDNFSDNAEYSVRVVHGGLPNVSYYAMSCMTNPISVKEYQEDMASVYPNPTRDNLTVKAENMKRITIVNTMGQVMYDQEVMSDSKDINMSQYESGVYMVHITTGNGVSTQRVTVVK